MRSYISNITGIYLVYLIALLPILGYVTFNYLGKPPQPILVYLSILIIVLLLIEKGTLKVPTYLIFYGLFTLYTIFSDILIVGQEFGVPYVRNNRYIGSFLLVLILENLFYNGKAKMRLFYILIANIIVTFFVILVQEFHNPNFLVIPGFNAGQGLNYDRLVSIYSWVDNRMAFGTLFLPIVVLVIEDAFKEMDNKRAILLYFAGLIITFFNRSRITIVQLFVSFLLVAIYKGFNIRTVLKYVLLLSIFLTGSYFALQKLNVGVDRIIEERILDSDARNLESSSAGGRIIAFEIFAKTFPKYPIFGKGKFFNSGVGEDTELLALLAGRSYQMHVGYLALIYYYGLFGGLLYIFFIISLSKKLYSDAKKTTYWAPFIGWLFYVLNNFTDVFIHFDFMGIMLMIAFNRIFLQETEYLSRTSETEIVAKVATSQTKH